MKRAVTVTPATKRACQELAREQDGRFCVRGPSPSPTARCGFALSNSRKLFLADGLRWGGSCEGGAKGGVGRGRGEGGAVGGGEEGNFEEGGGNRGSGKWKGRGEKGGVGGEGSNEGGGKGRVGGGKGEARVEGESTTAQRKNR